MTKKTVIIDYHKGNLLSVARGIRDAGGEAEVSDDPAVIAAAPSLVLPGVGSFGDAIAYMRESGQDEAVLKAVDKGVPFLGICLGLQLLFERGSEVSPGQDWARGLGIVAGSATRLESSRLKVPHVGWDQIQLTDHGRACPLFEGVAEGANVYFTHSYALDADVPAEVVCTHTHYARSFASSVWAGSAVNVFGVQFHPEKSSATGMQILRNYVRLVQKGGAA